MRLLHTMLRVGDLQRSIDFYTRVLGMTLLRQTDRPRSSGGMRTGKCKCSTPQPSDAPESAEIQLCLMVAAS